MKQGSVISLMAFGVILLSAVVFTRLAPAALNQEGVEADYDAVVSSGPEAYGVNIWWTDQEADLWAARWAELRPSWVRLFISHAIVEPVNDDNDPDHINWSGFNFDTPLGVSLLGDRTFTYRNWLEALNELPDVHLLIHFSYLAPWLSANPPHPGIPIPAAPYPPNDLAEYREFIEAATRFLVEDIGFPPERIAFEVMNEPDLPCGADPVTPCFWQDWTMNDIRDVVRVTHEVVEEIAPEIMLVGLAECCGTSVVRNLLDNYPEGEHLDGLSFHYYTPGNGMNVALDRAAVLAPYNRPIYLNEYGSLRYLSEGVEGALWHSLVLSQLWRAGIAPIQYPISEWPSIGEPYNSMGLFRDWRGGWERKPSYWVHANFFRFLGGGEIIAHTAPPALDVLVSRRTDRSGTQVVFWVVHRGAQPLRQVSFALHGFPASRARVHVYDNLASSTALTTETLEGETLIFTATLPARSSRAFVVSTEPRSFGRRSFLPAILRR
jgi:hypothetical protein